MIEEKICFVCNEKDNICICGKCTKDYTKNMNEYLIKLKTNSENLEESLEKLIIKNQKIFKMFNELNKLKTQNENLRNKYEFLIKENEQKKIENKNNLRKKIKKNDFKKLQIEYLKKSFKEMFIDKKNLIKISEFYIQQNEDIEEFDITKSLTLNIVNLKIKKNEEEIIINKNIEFSIFKNKKVYQKFKNFFYQIIDFLLDFQQKFNNEFSYKYELFKYFIKEKDVNYNLELNLNEINNLTEEQKNNFNHFLYLLNTDYNEIIIEFFGNEIIKQNDFFNLSPFINIQDLNKFSIQNEIDDFEIIDDFY